MLVVRKPSLSTIDAAEERGEHAGTKLKKTARPVRAGLPVVIEHVPRDRELRDGVAGERDRVRDVERVEGSPRHRVAG